LTRLIAHRGNIHGSIPSRENTINYIEEALDKGFDVEVDVWLLGEKFYLGHNAPSNEEITLEIMKDHRVWCHAKDIYTLSKLMRFHDVNCFFHDKDDVTLTSHGQLWTYPGKLLTPLSIDVLPERFITNLYDIGKWEYNIKVFGVCSDYVGKIIVV